MKRDDSKRARTEFLVLLALSSCSMHGYEIAKSIEERSMGFFRLPFGSLYPVLHRLEKEGLISAKWDEVTEKPKKTYSLTSKGKKSLKEELDHLQAFNGAIAMLAIEGI